MTESKQNKEIQQELIDSTLIDLRSGEIDLARAIEEIECVINQAIAQAKREGEKKVDFDWNVKSINQVIKNYLLPRMNNAVGKISDGYHTFNELYEFRKLYNAALFNEWALRGHYNVHRSKKHHDGEECFGGGWFIVMATLPDGQISNHYELKDWDLFWACEEREIAGEWDNHTSKDVTERLNKYLKRGLNT